MSASEAGAYEPLKLYDRRLRKAHREATKAYLDKLLAKAKIDEAENARRVKAIQAQKGKVRGHQRRLAWWTFLFVLLLIITLLLCIAAGFGLWSVFGEEGAPFDNTLLAILLATPIALALSLLTAKRRKAAQQALAQHEALLNQLLKDAWAQMAPLNEQLRWEVSIAIIKETTDLFVFDPLPSQARWMEFGATASGATPKFPNESATFALSGTVHGSPWLFLNGLRWQWEPKIYEGHLTIHWTELERDSRGRSRVVPRSQVLVATVEKPAPVFYEEARLLYGTPYARNLTFLRAPSDFTQEELGWWGRRKKRKAQKALEAYSRNLKDDSDYTMLNNAEFETLFCTKDRNDEHDFRVLFTPLAQTWMLALLNDHKVAFGDDFYFRKDGSIITITPEHLQEVSPDADVATCRDYDLKEVKRKFMAFEERYFKGFFAAFMPLLSVPLHQTPRPSLRVKKDDAPSEVFVEALANAHRDVFVPPKSVTESILVCHGTSERDFEVEAQGFTTVQHTDYVSRMGGDGHFHDVPVPWEEYLPLVRTTSLRVEPATSTSQNALLYRGYAALPR